MRLLYTDQTPSIASPDSSTGGPATGGHRVRAHWRAGHWQRYRVATRSPTGEIIGDRLGEQHIDWHYEGRWVRPTLVKASPRPDRSTLPTTIYIVKPAAATGPPDDGSLSSPS